jgi:hypothetical protein
VSFGTTFASSLLITGPSTYAAGVPFSLQVTALDDSGHVVPDYAGKVHFSSTDPLAHLPPDYSFQSGDFGSHIFQTSC